MKTRVIGMLILVLSIAGVLLYGWLVFFGGEQASQITLKLTALVAVAAIMAMLGWIGYTLVVTAPIARELREDSSEESQGGLST